jgi:hypothetical protein
MEIQAPTQADESDLLFEFGFEAKTEVHFPDPRGELLLAVQIADRADSAGMSEGAAHQALPPVASGMGHKKGEKLAELFDLVDALAAPGIDLRITGRLRHLLE